MVILNVLKRSVKQNNNKELIKVILLIIWIIWIKIWIKKIKQN